MESICPLIMNLFERFSFAPARFRIVPSNLRSAFAPPRKFIRERAPRMKKNLYHTRSRMGNTRSSDVLIHMPRIEETDKPIVRPDPQRAGTLCGALGQHREHKSSEHIHGRRYATQKEVFPNDAHGAHSSYSHQFFKNERYHMHMLMAIHCKCIRSKRGADNCALLLHLSAYFAPERRARLV